MTRNEMNLVNMFKTVDWFLAVNQNLLSDYPAILVAQSHLQSEIAIIDDLTETQAQGTKVQTGLKSNEKVELDGVMIKVSNAMGAEAAATNNQELKLIADWPKSLLNRLREGDYHVKVQQVYKVALPLAIQLSKWGVTLQEIESLNTLSDSLQKRTPDIRNVKVVSKQASTELRERISLQNTELKDTLDKLMKPLSGINPTLYGQYTNARIVIDKSASQSKSKEEITTANPA